ncbi:MAG: amidohydrolase family protein [Thermomicrobiales bacterium]|nr:amidohydrolase family protein [Thermomicrobiales bacterium]
MLTITNARLHTGYHTDAAGVVTTMTDLFTIKTSEGKIVAIDHQTDELEGDIWDANGLLAIPTTRDLHIHLDKGHFGGPWHAVVPTNGVPGRIREEEEFLPAFLEFLPERATALLRHVSATGTTHLRVQVNVDPVIGLQNYEIVRDVLVDHAHLVTSELVAFPQHGTLHTEQNGWLTKAMEAGAPILGGLDPFWIDGDLERSLRTTFDIAAKYGREVDFHLHTSGNLGLFEIQRILDYTRDYDMVGKVALSHALALGDASAGQLDELADQIATLQVSVFTTQPISYASGGGTSSVPWPTLMAHGVRVRVINDNINDHWSPFGTGDLLERASRSAEIWRQSDEKSLAAAYALVSDGVLPLSDSGERLWPNVGDEATFLFTNASCLSEVVARVPRQRELIVRGVRI